MCSWFKFNNLGLALGANLKFYTSLSKGLNLKVRKFWGLIPTFVEVTGEKLVGRPFCPSILNQVNTHIDQKNKKCNQILGLMKRLSVNFLRSAFLTIYKSFIRPHLEFGDILYDKPDNENSENKIEKVQYKACLAITGATQRTSREKLYEEL